MKKIIFLFCFFISCFALFSQNNALHFDGNNDLVIGSTNPLLEITTGTVELWINPQSKSTKQTFICYRNSAGSQTRYLWNFLENLSGIGFYNGSAYATFNYTFTSGQWYHLAFVGAETQTKIFINGNLVGVFAIPFGTASGNTLKLVLGNDIPLAEYFLGKMDELRIWNRALCSEEIVNFMNCGFSGNETNLVTYYKFNQGTAGGNNTAVTILLDSSASGVNGTLTNFSLNGLTSNWVSSTNGVSGTCSSVVCSPSHQIQTYYLITSDYSFVQEEFDEISFSMEEIQGWYQAETAGKTFYLNNNINVVYLPNNSVYYNVDYWGRIQADMVSLGYSPFTSGMINVYFIKGGGGVALGAQSCGNNCGLALFGMDIYPQFNTGQFFDCPNASGGVASWPCTPKGAITHELGHCLGLPHPNGVPATSTDANHSVMQTHWNYPYNYAAPSESPWGILTIERQTLLNNPFFIDNIQLLQKNEDLPIVNLPNTGIAPTANFSYTLNGNTIMLNNTSTNNISSYWTFGNEDISHLDNPVYTYNDYGTYTLRLRVVNSNGMMDLKAVNVNITALQNYTVTTSSNPVAGGTTTGGGTYNSGASVTVTATASPGYTFASWKENNNVVSTNASYTFNISANRTLQANFTQNPVSYTVTTSSNPVAGGTTTGGGTYNSGASVTVTATASPGYTFASWKENNNVVSTNASYTFNISANRTLQANFTQNPVSYTVTTSSNPVAGGTTTGGGTYNSGASVTVTATASPGYTFASWKENNNVVSTNASYTFNISANRTLQANFTQNPVSYTVTTSSNPVAGGTTTGGGTYNSGASVTVAATASPGYTFASWKENNNVVSTNASYTFNISANRTLQAKFTQNPVSYTVTTSSNPVAGGTTTGGGTYNSGASVTVTATASPGYTFASWKENNNVVSTNASYTFNISANRTLQSNFTINGTVPACTSLTSPVNGATNVAVNTDLTWGASAGATGYRLTIGTTSGGTQILNNVDVGNVTTYNPAIDFNFNTTIYITIVPYNNAGNATGCSQQSFTTQQQQQSGCGTISGVTATVQSSTSVLISWNLLPGVTQYRLRYRIVGTSVFTDSPLSTTNSLLLTGLVPGTTYEYQIKVKCNGVWSGYNSLSTFTTSSGGTVPPCTSLTSPVNGTNNVPVNANLTWAASAGATGYRLTIGTTSGGTQILNNVDVGNVTTYNPAIDFNFNTTIYVTIVPYNNAGNATGCSQQSFTTQQQQQSGCGTISGVTATVQSSTSVLISWNLLPGVNNYRLRYRIVGATVFTDGPISSSNSQLLTGLVPGTTYEYQIKVKCNGVWSDYNTLSTFTTPASLIGNSITDNDQDWILDPANMIITVFPNPGNGIFNLVIQSQLENEVNILITDVLGRQVFSNSWLVSKGENVDEIDLTNLLDGVYHLHIRQGDLKETKKIVIVK